MTKYQKVIRVGNSVAMTLDQMFIQQSGIRVGDSLAASYMPENRLFSVAQVKKGLNGSIAAENESTAIISAKIMPELKEWTDNFLKENKESLVALKNL